MKIHHWLFALVLFCVMFAALPDNYLVWSAGGSDSPLDGLEAPHTESSLEGIELQPPVRNIFPVFDFSALDSATLVPQWLPPYPRKNSYPEE